MDVLQVSLMGTSQSLSEMRLIHESYFNNFLIITMTKHEARVKYEKD